MTNKIYEYIDENNWYIGEWTLRKAGYHFNDIPYRLLEHIDAELSELIERDLDEDYNAFTTVVRSNTAHPCLISSLSSI